MAGRSKSKSKALAVAPSAKALERFKKAGIACGYDPDTMARLAARCQGMPLSAKGRIRLDDQELVAAIEVRLADVLEYFDDHALAKMSGRDLMVALGILIDKRQLLKGQPTEITKREDVTKLDAFLEEVAEELKRRGEGPDVIDVTLAAPVSNASNGGMG